MDTATEEVEVGTEVEVEADQANNEENKTKNEEKSPAFAFKAKIKREVIEDFLKSLSVIADVGKIAISENGIEAKMINSGNYAMATTTLNKKGMYSYSTSKDGVIGIPIKTVLKLVGKAKKNGTVQIEYLPKTDEQEEILKIAAGDLHYDLPPTDLEYIDEPSKAPQIIFPVGITLRCKKFSEIITLVEEVAGEITFTVPADEDKLIAESNRTTMEGKPAYPHVLITVENGDILKFESVKENKNEDENIRVRKGEIKATFDAEDLKKMSKIIAKMGKVTIRTDTDYPCEIETLFANDYGKIKYLIAPRIN